MASFACIKRNFNEYIWPGLGLFGESYVLFSIGTIKPIWEILYPKCFVTVEICSQTLLSSLTYSVVTGIIFGMIIIGMLSGRIGRRTGSITTAALMALGSAGLTFGSLQFTSNPELMLKNMTAFLFIFGAGVGGEYPLSASSASERAMSAMKERMQQEENQNASVVLIPDGTKFDAQSNGRGKRVIIVFSMQGMGIFINTLTLTMLLWMTGQHGAYYDEDANQNNGDDYYAQGHGYDRYALLRIWQIVYFLGTFILAYVLVSRWIHLEESSVWEEDKVKRQEVMNSDKNEYCPPLGDIYFIENQEVEKNMIEMPLGYSKLRLMMLTYGTRLFGTSFSWLLWDIAFYGNKLFQSSFLYALTGEDATLIEISSGKFL